MILRVKLVIASWCVSAIALPMVGLGEELRKEDRDKTEVIQLQEVVVTAPGISVADIATVDEVTAEEIELYGASNLKEALSLIPGISPVQYCPCKGEGEFLLRGYNQKSVRILVDGIPIGDTARNGRTGFPISEFPAGNIERIKVIKGIPSVLYGSNDYGGVINIITKCPVSEKPEFNISSEWGTNDTQSHSFGLGRNAGKFSYWISGTHSESDGIRLSSDYDPEDFVVSNITGDPEAFDNNPQYEDGGDQDNSDYDRDSFTIRLGAMPGAETNFSLLYMYNKSEQGLPIPPNPYLPMSAYPWYWRWPDNETHNISLSGSKEGMIYGKRFDVKARVYYISGDEELICYTDPTYSAQKWEEHSDTSTTGIKINADYGLSQSHLFRFGIDYRVDAEDRMAISGDTVNPEQEFEVETTSVAIEDEIHLTDNIIVNIGSSLNFFDIKEMPAAGSKPDYTEFNPQIGIAYAPRDNIGIHLSCGRKVAFPRMKDMYPVGQWNPMFRSNFDLEPEEVFALETGIEGKIGQIRKVSLTLFRDEIEDMIESGPAPGGGMWMENKTDKRIIQGIEFNVDINLLENLSWGIGYCFLDTEEKDTGEDVVFRPKHSGNSYLRYIFDFGLTAQIDFDFSSKKRTKIIKYVDMPPPKPVFDYVRLGDYLFVNLRLQQKIKEHCTLYFRLTNIFDGDEQDAFCPRQRLKPLPGRMFIVGMDLKF